MFTGEWKGLRPTDLFGLRPALLEHGVRVEATVAMEAFAALDGGLRRDATFLDADRLTADARRQASARLARAYGGRRRRSARTAATRARSWATRRV